MTNSAVPATSACHLNVHNKPGRRLIWRRMHGLGPLASFSMQLTTHTHVLA